MDIQKKCGLCGLNKPLEDFHVRSASPDGRQGRCKPCSLSSHKAWSDDNPGRAAVLARTWRDVNPEAIKSQRKRGRFYRYGITEEQYNTMLEAQGRCCAVCKGTEPGAASWSIDHDHSCCDRRGSCGTCVRGLLCRPCNSGMGLFRDNAEALESAAHYVRSYANG